MPVIFPILSSLATAIRLPALAAFFGGLFAQMAGFFATRFTVGTAVQLAAISSIVGLTVVLLSVFHSIVYGLSVITPPYFNNAMSLIVPSNLLPCVTAIMSAKVVRWVWEWQVFFIQQVAGAGK